MLTIIIPEEEFFDAKTNEFTYGKKVTLNLEHSLVSVSRWEAKWQKPFLSKDPKTKEETLDYIRCMSISQNITDDILKRITPGMIAQVQAYIDSPMTATWFNENKNSLKKNKEIITSEIIYYWMVALNIPFECQKWHLNRLLTLIKVCDIKSAPQKNMGRQEVLNNYRTLNAQRKAKLGTKG